MSGLGLSQLLSNSYDVDYKQEYIQEWVQQQSKLVQHCASGNSKEDDSVEEPLPPIISKRRNLVGGLKTRQGSVFISSSRNKKKQHHKRKSRNGNHNLIKDHASAGSSLENRIHKSHKQQPDSHRNIRKDRQKGKEPDRYNNVRRVGKSANIKEANGRYSSDKVTSDRVTLKYPPLRENTLGIFNKGKASKKIKTGVSRLAFSESRFLNEQQSSLSVEVLSPAKSLPWKSKLPSQDHKSSSTELVGEIPEYESRAEPSSASKSLRARVTPSNSQLSTILTGKKDEVVPDSQLGKSSMDGETGAGSVMMLQVDNKLASKWNMEEASQNPKDKEKEDTKELVTNMSVKSGDSDLSPSLLLLMEECDHGEILSPIKRSNHGESDKLDVLLAEISSGPDVWNEEDLENANFENPENSEHSQDMKYESDMNEAAFFTNHSDINPSEDKTAVDSFVGETHEENDEEHVQNLVTSGYSSLNTTPYLNTHSDFDQSITKLESDFPRYYWKPHRLH